MGSKCTICIHPKRKKIDAAILDGESRRSIANRFGVSEAAVQRHKKHILPKVPAEVVAVAILDPATETIKAKPEIRGFDLDGLFDKMQVMIDKNFEIVEKYELLDPEGNFIGTAADVKAKASAITSMKGTLEFIAKMFGLISSDGVSPGYLQLQDRHEKMKQFVMEHMCDDCRVEFLKHLEE